MNNIVECRREITDFDRLISGYINTMSGEYADELLWYENRWEVYWTLTSLRRHMLLFYPFPQDTDILVSGDKFGTLTGILCEKCKNVTALVSSLYYKEAILKRYSTRNNLSVLHHENFSQDQKNQWTCILVNLEYICNYNWNDSYEFDMLVLPAIKLLSEHGRILLSIPGGKYYDVIRLLQKHGLTHHKTYDPLRNGAFLIEASRKEISTAILKKEGYYRTPLLDDVWFRKHDILFLAEDVPSQDFDLIQDVKKVQVDLLTKIASVCRENGLKVYPIYGTLLGMMRDGGMIRDDDDIDVALFRDDYEKLMALSERFTGKYFLQTPSNDDCFFGGYAKLRNRETTAIQPQNWWTDCCEGISIDIFPIDITFSDERKEARKRKKIQFYQRMLYAKAYGDFRDFKDMPLLKWKAFKYFGKLFSREYLAQKLYEVMQSGDSKSRIAVYCHYGNGGLNFPKYMLTSDFKESFEFLFENCRLDVPAGWEHLLRTFYGDGYVERHGFCEGKRRHGFYDVNIPYAVYKKKFGGLKHPHTIEEPIVFLGDGSVFNACLKYYKDKVNVAHLVQLPGECPMRPVMGIQVETWEEFIAKDIDKQSYRAIICSGDVRVAEKILENAGFNNYYIFWHDRNWMLYANQSQIWKDIRGLST